MSRRSAYAAGSGAAERIGEWHHRRAGTIAARRRSRCIPASAPTRPATSRPATSRPATSRESLETVAPPRGAGETRLGALRGLGVVLGEVLDELRHGELSDRLQRVLRLDVAVAHVRHTLLRRGVEPEVEDHHVEQHEQDHHDEQRDPAIAGNPRSVAVTGPGRAQNPGFVTHVSQTSHRSRWFLRRTRAIDTPFPGNPGLLTASLVPFSADGPRKPLEETEKRRKEISNNDLTS